MDWPLIPQDGLRRRDAAGTRSPGTTDAPEMMTTMKASAGSMARDWLPARLRQWVGEHEAVLEVVAVAFCAMGRWPDPVALERRLRAQGRKLGVPSAMAAMPRELGWREYSPSRVTLTLFGLACAPAGAKLLEGYVAALRVALERFDSAEGEPRLSRAQLQQRLRLPRREMDVLSSLLLMPGNPFLTGGNANHDSWDMDIDERVVAFEDVHTAEQLIRRLAEQRLAVASVSTAPAATDDEAESPSPSQSTRSVDPTELTVAILFVLTLVADVAGALAAPGWLLGAGIGAGIGVVAARRRLRESGLNATTLAVIAGPAALGAGGALVIAATGPAPLSATQRYERRLVRTLRADTPPGRRIAARANAVLRSGGGRSTVVVLRDSRPSPASGDIPTDAAGRFLAPGSDEIRIYDDVAGRPQLSFRFLPQGPGHVHQPPENDLPALHFTLRAVQDVDGDEHAEITGAFERSTLATGPLPAPVVIGWNAQARRYRLAALSPKPAVVLPRNIAEAFTRPTRIVDRVSGARINAHATDAYYVQAGASEAALVTAYRKLPQVGDTVESYFVDAWTVDLRAQRLERSRCWLSTRTEPVALPPPLSRSLLRVARVRAQPPCYP